MTGTIRIEGSRLVDPQGTDILLRGCGLGGWMNTENFISGYPGTESQHRSALARVIGAERSEAFFDRFLDAFFGDADARFLRENAVNSVRLPINYRHFERDDAPFELLEKGFAQLDRVVDVCARNGLYTIIDLHALPGFQNQGWHSDNPTHKAFFWDHRHFQDRVVHLWRELATRYRGNPWVAGYNLINEPADPTGDRLIPVYERLCEEIWDVDPDHLIFLEGNRYSTDFSMFGEPWPGVVYTLHDYALSGFVDAGPYPGISRGSYIDRAELRATFERRAGYMLENDLPMWVGEFGPVYSGMAPIDEMRYQVLRDQLDIYEEAGAHWSLWTYKDVDVQGMVHLTADSPWRTGLARVLRKKVRLGVDSWGATDAHVRSVMQPLEDLFTAAFPDYEPFPFGGRWFVHRLARHILFSEPMAHDWAESFRGMSDVELDRMVDSFRFEHCTPRSRLLQELAPYLH